MNLLCKIVHGIHLTTGSPVTHPLKNGALTLPAPPDAGVVVVSVWGERRGETALVPEIWPVSEPSSNHSAHTELMDMVSSS